ncbi:STAS domain-containing protein [Balneatrix alpica]|uniref:Lipid asymmetry maintenance protein MlaB n=1 Tax=Balneatrix alpica TaxID=75684 RepID=A0ABV5Z8Z1_9GAMM|nr:STAS domain-containing protein [Balneatrix alpica]
MLVEAQGDTLVLEGAVDVHTVQTWRKQAEQALAQMGDKVLVDVSRLSASGMVVLSLLLCVMRAGQARQQQILFSPLPAPLAAMAELADLDEVLPVHV